MKDTILVVLGFALYGLVFLISTFVTARLWYLFLKIIGIDILFWVIFAVFLLLRMLFWEEPKKGDRQ